jgi:5-methylcytosine-specific restriction endonuclease McrA
MTEAQIERKRKVDRERKSNRRAEYFKDKECVKCGSTEELQLDHIDPSKKKTHRIWNFCDKKRAAELKKCQPLCTECHLEKTIEDIRRMRKNAHGTLNGYVKWRCRCPDCMKVGRTIRSEEYTSGVDIENIE